jgi:cysteine desulfuration protein SufE
MDVNTLNKRQEEVVEEFSYFDEWMDKYEHIIELGKEMERMPEERKSDDLLIKGCQSRVWLDARHSADGAVRFSADSDAIITRGLVALMVRVLDGLSPQTVAQADLWFLDKIGLKEHLSPTRANGLLAMVKQLKTYGLAYMARG